LYTQEQKQVPFLRISMMRTPPYTVDFATRTAAARPENVFIFRYNCRNGRCGFFAIAKNPLVRAFATLPSSSLPFLFEFIEVAYTGKRKRFPVAPPPVAQ
jgi:hypothetical protein